MRCFKSPASPISLIICILSIFEHAESASIPSAHRNVNKLHARSIGDTDRVLEKRVYTPPPPPPPPPANNPTRHCPTPSSSAGLIDPTCPEHSKEYCQCCKCIAGSVTQCTSGHWTGMAKHYFSICYPDVDFNNENELNNWCERPANRVDGGEFHEGIFTGGGCTCPPTEAWGSTFRGRAGGAASAANIQAYGQHRDQHQSSSSNAGTHRQFLQNRPSIGGTMLFGQPQDQHSAGANINVPPMTGQSQPQPPPGTNPSKKRKIANTDLSTSEDEHGTWPYGRPPPYVVAVTETDKRFATTRTQKEAILYPPRCLGKLWLPCASTCKCTRKGAVSRNSCWISEPAINALRENPEIVLPTSSGVRWSEMVCTEIDHVEGGRCDCPELQRSKKVCNLSNNDPAADAVAKACNDNCSCLNSLGRVNASLKGGIVPVHGCWNGPNSSPESQQILMSAFESEKDVGTQKGRFPTFGKTLSRNRVDAYITKADKLCLNYCHCAWDIK